MKEQWNSKFGVILAVAGSAVGLGNFLRFPGKVAEFGGGAFMLAYFIAFLLIGLPICWAEWTMARYGGIRGFHSAPGIFNAISRHPMGKYLGVIGIVIPLTIYMYYVVIESWCLGYAMNFLTGGLRVTDAGASSDFFGNFIGISKDGAGLGFGLEKAGLFLAIVFTLNFFLIYRGINKGIEFFCKWAMPMLLFIAVLILVRVLTLGTPDENHPDRSVNNGLGFMWNPNKVFLEKAIVNETSGTVSWVRDSERVDPKNIIQAEILAKNDPENFRVSRVTMGQQLKNPDLWLEAAGQIFFSLSVGFGVILTYASYMKKEDDIVLSGLAATSANEFCEVSLGGLITLPASVAFLGVSGIASLGTFGLGFVVLPPVFGLMPGGVIFGFLFFFLLFIAAVTSSLSMLQPGIAFLEGSFGINRKQSVLIVGLLTLLGCSFVFYFSEGLKSLDTIDFWVGTFLIFVFSTIQILLFSWVFGIDKGFAEAHQGAKLTIPDFYKWVMKWVTPTLLILIFGMWVSKNLFGFDFSTMQGGEPSGYIKDLWAEPNLVAQLSFVLVLVVIVFCLLVLKTSKRYPAYQKEIQREAGK